MLARPLPAVKKVSKASAKTLTQFRHSYTLHCNQGRQRAYKVFICSDPTKKQARDSSEASGNFTAALRALP